MTDATFAAVCGLSVRAIRVAAVEDAPPSDSDECVACLSVLTRRSQHAARNTAAS
jgi:hypothetical protein